MWPKLESSEGVWIHRLWDPQTLGILVLWFQVGLKRCLSGSQVLLLSQKLTVRQMVLH